MSQPLYETYHSAKQAALRQIRTSDRTEAEIHQKLLIQGFQEQEIGLALKSLRDSGYIDDNRVAKRSAELACDKAKGKLKIEADLKARGASEEAVKVALESLGEELPRALKALQTRQRPKDTPAKAAAFLQRQGYDEETVRSAIEQTYHVEL